MQEVTARAWMAAFWMQAGAPRIAAWWLTCPDDNPELMQAEIVLALAFEAGRRDALESPAEE